MVKRSRSNPIYRWIKNLAQRRKEWIAGLSEKKREKHFSIETREKILIGNIVLRIAKKPENRFAELGIIIGEKRYWGQGCGTDAMTAILKYAFHTLKLHRVQLSVVEFNARAIKVYQNLGFKLEGRRRERVFHNGKFKNSFEMGILDREWKKRTK